LGYCPRSALGIFRFDAGIRAKAAAGGGGEIQKGLCGCPDELFPAQRDASAKSMTAAEEQAVELLQLDSFLRVESGATQANDIETANAAITARQGVGRDVFADGTTALHEGKGANADELMDETVTGDKSAVTNDHMATQQSAIDQDDVVAKMGIMADVTTGHQQIMRADNGMSIGLGRAMDGNMFAENVVVANQRGSGFASVFQVLRGVTDDRTRVEMIMASRFKYAGEINVRADDTMLTQRDLGVNDRIRPDLGCVRHLGVRMNDGRGMNHLNGDSIIGTLFRIGADSIAKFKAAERDF
jgi:hypothetical protein